MHTNTPYETLQDPKQVVGWQRSVFCLLEEQNAIQESRIVALETWLTTAQDDIADMQDELVTSQQDLSRLTSRVQELEIIVDDLRQN